MIRDCIFCKIAAGEMEAKVIYRDELVTAFWDIRPVKPVHILVVPNKHIDSVNEIAAEDEALLGHLFTVAKKIAAEQGVSDSGYRLIVNTGPHARQSVMHLHLHILAGAPMETHLGKCGTLD